MRPHACTQHFRFRTLRRTRSFPGRTSVRSFPGARESVWGIASKERAWPCSFDLPSIQYCLNIASTMAWHGGLDASPPSLATCPKASSLPSRANRGRNSDSPRSEFCHRGILPKTPSSNPSQAAHGGRRCRFGSSHGGARYRYFKQLMQVVAWASGCALGPTSLLIDPHGCADEPQLLGSHPGADLHVPASFFPCNRLQHNRRSISRKMSKGQRLLGSNATQ